MMTTMMMKLVCLPVILLTLIASMMDTAFTSTSTNMVVASPVAIVFPKTSTVSITPNLAKFNDYNNNDFVNTTYGLLIGSTSQSVVVAEDNMTPYDDVDMELFNTSDLDLVLFNTSDFSLWVPYIGIALFYGELMVLYMMTRALKTRDASSKEWTANSPGMTHCRHHRIQSLKATKRRLEQAQLERHQKDHVPTTPCCRRNQIQSLKATKCRLEQERLEQHQKEQVWQDQYSQGLHAAFNLGPSVHERIDTICEPMMKLKFAYAVDKFKNKLLLKYHPECHDDKDAKAIYQGIFDRAEQRKAQLVKRKITFAKRMRAAAHRRQVAIIGCSCMVVCANQQYRCLMEIQREQEQQSINPVAEEVVAVSTTSTVAGFDSTIAFGSVGTSILTFG